MHNARLKVLYIDASAGFGGATKSLSLLLQGLRTIDPIVVTHQYQHIAQKSYNGFPVYRVPLPLHIRLYKRLEQRIHRKIPILLARRIALKTLNILHRLQKWASILYVLWIARSNRIDLIHANNGFTTPGAVFVSRWLRIPCVVHERGFCNPQSKAVFAAIRQTTHVIAVSSAVAESVHRQGLPNGRITTVHDPVDTDLFDKVSAGDEREARRVVYGLCPDDIAVGIFGRVIPWKGQLEFVYAILQVMKRRERLKAFIVGDESDGPPSYFAHIRHVIDTSGYAQRFILTGYRDDVETLYSIMDIVVHASLDPEPFGMVVTEAMAAGRPVIAAKAGGPVEVITPGVDGILVPPGNVDEMAAAILQLSEDPALRASLAKNAHAKVRTHYSIGHIASKVERLYHELLPRPQAN